MVYVCVPAKTGDQYLRSADGRTDGDGARALRTRIAVIIAIIIRPIRGAAAAVA